MSERFQTLIREPELPTSELYFSHAMAPYIGAWGDPAKPIAAISSNAFFAQGERGNFLIVLRKISKAARKAFTNLPAHELVYLLDDDFSAGLNDSSLPLDYRARLLVVHRNAKKLLQKADHVIVSSTNLADVVEADNGRPHCLEPALIGPVAPIDHFDDVTTINMVYTGTRSHLADFQFIAPAIRRVLDDNDNLHLTTFFGDYLKPQYRHPRLINHNALNWRDFRRFLLGQRFHIALVVGRQTRFNNSRSVNKLLECALLGAAPLISGAMPFAGRVSHFSETPYHSDNPDDLAASLSNLVADRDRCRCLALGNASFVESLQGVETQRKFWVSLLGLSTL